jgi:uncharacterized protein (DUF2147 family)
MFKFVSGFIYLLIMSNVAMSQGVLGKWKTVDNETGEVKAIVDIYEKSGEVYGKIIEIFDPSKKYLPCIYCKGEDYNKPILNLDIIKKMKKDGDVFKGGTITDPQNGKTYACRLRLQDKNTLEVRGYLFFFFATQYWIRIKE